MLFSSRVKRIRFSVWLVEGYAHVIILLSAAMSLSCFKNATKSTHTKRKPYKLLKRLNFRNKILNALSVKL